jgi:hypothetical protein
LSEKEVVDRLRDALTSFDTAAAAIEELTASGATVLEELGALTKGLLSDNEHSFFITFLLHGWFALVPPGSRAPELDYQGVVADLARELERAPSWMEGEPDEAMTKMISGCRQPVLMQFVMAEMFQGSAKAPKKLRPSPEAMLPMIAILKTMLNEVDRALRMR